MQRYSSVDSAGRLWLVSGGLHYPLQFDRLLQMVKKVESEAPTLEFKILVFLEKIPSYLKNGPWSPVAHLYLIILCGYILLSSNYAVALYSELTDVNSIKFISNATANSDWIQYYRIFGTIYMLCITALVFHTSGFWPLVSYTVTSWNLATIRLFSSFIGASNFSFSPQFQTIAGKVNDQIITNFNTRISLEP